MNIVFFSSNIDIIDELKQRHNIVDSVTCYDSDSLIDLIENKEKHIIISDYDSVSAEINNLISSASLPENFTVLEKEPSVATGKMLILRGVKAYGNIRMLSNHFQQMIQTVGDGNIWTYPELTAILSKISDKPSINDDALKLIKSRLTDKELEVIYLILEGLTNDAIASKLAITTRTVKAHVSSIFSKLHVNDRISLVLLLK